MIKFIKLNFSLINYYFELIKHILNKNVPYINVKSYL